MNQRATGLRVACNLPDQTRSHAGGYDCLVPVAGKFDGLGVVPYTLAVLSAQMQRMELAHDC